MNRSQPIAPLRPALLLAPFATLALLLGLFLTLLPASRAAQPDPQPASPPAPGQIRINEVLRDPLCRGDGLGEYFELFNLSNESFNLQGCTISDNDDDSFTVAGSLPIDPGGYLLFCLNGNPSLNGGLDCDYDYAGMSLGNFADELALTCGDVEVARIEWDGGQSWPNQAGAAMIYCGPGPAGDGQNWTDSTLPINPGLCAPDNTTDRGSPGRSNDCPPVLSASKQVAPAGPVAYGQMLTYQVTISNTGAITAFNLLVTDTHSVLGDRVLAGPLDFPVGSADFLYTYTVRPADCFTTISNSVFLDAPDALRPGSSAVITTPVACIGPQTPIVKRSSPSAVITASAVLTFHIAFTNTGDLSDTLWITDAGPAFAYPLRAACASQPPGWPAPAARPYGPLAIGQAGQIAITCTVAATPVLVTQTIPLNNVVSARCASYPLACAPTSASAGLTLTILPAAGPALSLVKSAGPALALTGSGQITYALAISNSGDYTASLVITDTGPPVSPGIALACASDPPGLPASGGVSFGDLPAGRGLNVMLACNATVTQTTYPQVYALVNQALASCAGGLCPAAGDSATLTVTVPPLQPRLQVVKRVRPPALSTAATAMLTFTVALTNSGDYTGSFTLSDPGPLSAPEGLSFGGCQPAVPYSETLVLGPGQARSAPLTLACAFATTPGLVTQTYAVSNVVAVAIAETGAGGLAAATAAITVPALYPGLALAKVAAPAWQTATHTARITYTIALTNSGDLAATFLLNDPGPQPPAGLQPAGCSPPFPLDRQFSLGPGQALNPPLSVVCAYTVTQDVAPQVFSLANAAGAVISETGAAEQVTATAIISTPPLTPAVALSKQASPSAVFAGGLVTYTYQVTNVGQTYLAPITVTDDLLGAVCAADAPLAPGAHTTCWQSAVITTDTINVGSVLAQPANAAGLPYATPPLNASASASVTLLTPAIALDKRVSAGIVERGLPVTYTYQVTNTGNVHLRPITVTDDVEGAICILGAGLAPGTSTACTKVSFPLTHTLNVGSAAGKPATAAGLPLPPAPVTATAAAFLLVVPPPQADLIVVKSDDPDPAQPGGSIIYSVFITNTGPEQARSVTLQDALPEALAFVVASSGCQHNGVSPGGVVTCGLQPGPLFPGASAWFVIVADVVTTRTGLISNTVVVSTTSEELQPADNVATTTTYVGQPPDLRIAKRGNLTPQGDSFRLRYTLTVTNAGPDLATGVVISDQLPAVVVFEQATAGCVHDGAAAGGLVTCAVQPAPLPPATTAAVTVAVGIAPGVSGLVTNTASVAGAEPDPDLANNSATLATFVPVCDVNGSGGVEVADVQAVAGAFGAESPPAPPTLDLVRDGVIDVRDVVLAAQCWLAAQGGVSG